MINDTNADTIVTIHVQGDYVFSEVRFGTK